VKETKNQKGRKEGKQGRDGSKERWNLFARRRRLDKKKKKAFPFEDSKA